MVLSVSKSQLQNISFVIHARPLTIYDAGSDEMPLKHLGFSKWPTIRGWNLRVLVELQQNKAVNFSLCFLPLHVLFGII
jgi:hypothetical protein